MRSKTIWRVILMALCAACTLLLPRPARAAEAGFTYEVHDGKATITGCTLQNISFLEIPQTVNGYPVVSIGPSAFENRTDLMEVTIPEGVKIIDAYAFYECYGLTWLYLPDSLESIGEKAFCSCKDLEVVEYGIGLKSIGDGAFSFCKKLNFYLELPNGLERIGTGAYYDCDSLETVLLPKSLKDLGSKAFAMCGRLTSVHMPDGLEHIGSQVLYESACYRYNMYWYGDGFYMGTYLLQAKKTVSGSYTPLNGTRMIADGAFENCDGLTQIRLPDSLESIGANAFANCDSLDSIVIPAGVTAVGDRAFYGCSAAETVSFPDSVAYLGQDAFTNTGYYKNPDNWKNGVFYVGGHLLSCRASLSGTLSVLPGTKTVAAGALKEATGLTALILPDSLESIGAEAFAGCTGLQKLAIPDGVTAIGEKAFYGCSSIKSLHLGEGLLQLGTGAFGQCKSLESITADSQNRAFFSRDNCLIRTKDQCLVLGCRESRIPQGVTAIGPYAFADCEGLLSLTLPDTVLTVGEGAFQNCDGLLQIDLGQGLQTIEARGFGYNHGLTHVELPSSLLYLGEETFSGCSGLRSVVFREGLCTIGKNCFAFCESLQAACLPDSLQELREGAFYGCESLSSLTLGKGLTAIGDTAFDGCIGLTTLTVPNSVQTIGRYAFYECKGLQQADLGQVKEIGQGAFEACESLRAVHIPASVAAIGTQVFSHCTALEQMTVSPQNPYYHSQGNCVIRTADKCLIYGCQTSCIPNDGSVTVIDGYAFAGCKGLKSILVPDTVTRIHAYAFYRCNGLTKMQLPFVGGEARYDNYLGYIFGGGPTQNDLYVPGSLKQVIVTGGSLVGDFGFSKCSGLQEVLLPETVVTLGQSAFANCKQLQKVILPGNLKNWSDAALFSGSNYAMLYVSAGQESTLSLAKSYGVPHRIGGLITFLDENAQIREQTWYPVNAAIRVPEAPDGLLWDPLPAVCTGNQRFCLRRPGQETASKGDVNSDQTVDNRDVEYLLWHTLFPEAYPISAGADLTGDGKTDNLDVAYLLWHTLFPETYPI